MVSFLAINKPAGLTSHDAVLRVRKVTGQKAGHSGTLDPEATGLLLVLLDQATKLAPLFAGLPKKYRATIRLGLRSDTDDVWGEVISESPVPEILLADIEKTLAEFSGTVKQKVPAFSAVKSQGQPLYKKARKGIEVETPEKEVTFHSIRVLEWNSPDVVVEVSCSAGTYIRALARDFGEKIGCGAAMSSLARLEVGSVSLVHAVALDKLAVDNWRNFVLNPEEVLPVPCLRLKAETEKVRKGQSLFLSDLGDTDDLQKGQPVFLKDEKNELLAWGRMADSVSALRENPRQPAVVYGRVLV